MEVRMRGDECADHGWLRPLSIAVCLIWTAAALVVAGVIALAGGGR